MLLSKIDTVEKMSVLNRMFNFPWQISLSVATKFPHPNQFFFFFFFLSCKFSQLGEVFSENEKNEKFMVFRDFSTMFQNKNK